MTLYLIHFGIFILIVLFLIWWRNNCEYTDPGNKFPTRGHIVFIGVVSLIPILNLIVLAIIIAIYVNLRIDEDLMLKKTKFNKYWFDINE